MCIRDSTYIGALLLAMLSALSGKYLSEMGLYFLGLNRDWKIVIGWPVAFLSAFIGTFSHVLLDSIMHADVQPFFPINTDNALLGLITIEALHKVCLYSGLAGGTVYFALHLWRRSYR